MKKRYSICKKVMYSCKFQHLENAIAIQIAIIVILSMCIKNLIFLDAIASLDYWGYESNLVS